MRSGFILANNWLVVDGNANPETVLADGSFPVSGAFVAVSPNERFHIVVKQGALADALTWTIQTAESINGALTDFDTANLQKVGLATDDGQYIVWTIETAYFPADATHVTLTLSGVAGSNFAAITYYLPGHQLPVTQDSAVLPSDNQLVNGT